MSADAYNHILLLFTCAFAIKFKNDKFIYAINKICLVCYIARPKKHELMRKSNFAMRPQKCIGQKSTDLF